MSFSIEPLGGELGPELVFEPASHETHDRFHILVDEVLAAVLQRAGDSWLLHDVAGLGFGEMSFAGGLDEDALADVTLDALGDWIDDHRPDLWRRV